MTEAQTLRHIISTRKSIFPPEYSDAPITKEVLEEIISSADYAPNHKRTKPWRLKAYRGTDKALLGEELVRLYKENVPAENFSERKMNEIAQKVAKSDTIVTIRVGRNSCNSDGCTKYVPYLHCPRRRLLLGHSRLYVSNERFLTIRRK